MTLPYTLHLGDCLATLRGMADNSVDAVVSDPPYGLSQHTPAEVLECLKAWLAGEVYQPKGKGFMGAAWDAWVPGPEVWRECLRVLKPGGHVLAFAGTRSMDLMSMAIRLAGFELRDAVGYAHDGGGAPLLAWCFGSGFPKSHNVSKAIDREAGAEREVVGGRFYAYADSSRASNKAIGHGLTGCNIANPGGFLGSQIPITAPATEAARQWAGFGTALKPAWEPIILARKPLEGSVAANVRAHGTGAMNIDGCRVGEGVLRSTGSGKRDREDGWGMQGGVMGGSDAGRWPANLIHDGSDEVLAGFPQAPGAQGVVTGKEPSTSTRNNLGLYGERAASIPRGDTGSAARFFYCAKASRKDRNEGFDSFVEVTIEWSQSLESNAWENEARKVQLLVDTEQSHPRATVVFGAQNNSATEWSTMLFGSGTTGQSQQGLTSTTKTRTSCTTPLEILSFCQSSITNESTRDASSGEVSCGSLAGTAEQSTLLITTTNEQMASALGAEHAASPMRLRISASAAKSGHPTVKPVDLMAYLCRLVTPPGGTVLDPFMGSGSTGKAAMREGFRFIGCELSPEYLDIARARIAHELARVTAANAPPAPAPQFDLFAS